MVMHSKNNINPEDAFMDAVLKAVKEDAVRQSAEKLMKKAGNIWDRHHDSKITTADEKFMDAIVADSDSSKLNPKESAATALLFRSAAGTGASAPKSEKDDHGPALGK